MRRSGDKKFKAGFVIRPVYTRYPMMSPVRPIISKESSVAIFVFGNDKTIVGNAMITERDDSSIPEFCIVIFNPVMTVNY